MYLSDFKTQIQMLLLLFAICVLIASGLEQRPCATGQPRLTKDLLSKEWELSWPPKITDVRAKLAIHDRFVPVIGASRQRKYSGSFLEKRQELFDIGCYPGVEYRLKGVEVTNGLETSQFTTVSEALSLAPNDSIYLSIRPAYPLIPQLEREWPVRVKLSSIPWCLSRGAYNVVTVASSAILAASFLLAAFSLSFGVTLSVVNTKSMEPSILPKDVILVEKVSPILKRLGGMAVAQPGDIVFFQQPEKMAQYLQSKRLPRVKAGELIVKRVKGGDAKCLEVRGDYSQVSVDSRDWGCLPVENVVGTPLFRVFPTSRIGPLQ